MCRTSSCTFLGSCSTYSGCVCLLCWDTSQYQRCSRATQRYDHLNICLVFSQSATLAGSCVKPSLGCQFCLMVPWSRSQMHKICQDVLHGGPNISLHMLLARILQHAVLAVSDCTLTCQQCCAMRLSCTEPHALKQHVQVTMLLVVINAMQG